MSCMMTACAFSTHLEPDIHGSCSRLKSDNCVTNIDDLRKLMRSGLLHAHDVPQARQVLLYRISNTTELAATWYKIWVLHVHTQSC